MEFKYKSGHAFPTEGFTTGVSICGTRFVSYNFTSEGKETMNCKACLDKMTNGVRIKQVSPKIPVIPKKGSIKNEKLQIAECPFCNHDKAKCLSMKRDSKINPGMNYQVVCNKCKGRGPLVPDSEKKAIDLWNRTF